MTAETTTPPSTEPVRIPRDILDVVDKRAAKAAKVAGVERVSGMRTAIVASLLREALGLAKPQG